MNIVVVGGGTAGWITALYAKRIFPESTISLIESDAIGILGAGEGSTPHMVGIFDFLNIPISELIKNCSTTIKNGIKFTNWDSNEYYYHPFSINQNLSGQSNSFNKNFYLGQDYNYFHLFEEILKVGKHDGDLIDLLSESNRVPFIKNKFIERKMNPILSYNTLSSWSIHFDATKLANYLKNIGLSRGIKRIEGIVSKINADSDGYISSLQVSEKLIPSDFVFDCTGFSRLIIGEFYKSEWKSHSESLPAKRAAPFFLPIENNKIPAYTESIAMDYGWVWKIPLQHRYGCGYVFDSDFISDDNAILEIKNKFGHDVEINRFFNFSPGVFKEVWINNCLSVGLSSGFIEPLEATSIWQSILLLRNFFSDKNNIKTRNKNIKRVFNNIYFNQTEEVVDFIYLHYVTKKTETNFWKNFTKNNKMPEFIKYVLDVSEEKIISDGIDFRDKSMFYSPNYLYIMDGNNLLSKISKKNHMGYLNNEEINSIKNIFYNNRSLYLNCTDHRMFLEDMKT